MIEEAKAAMTAALGFITNRAKDGTFAPKVDDSATIPASPEQPVAAQVKAPEAVEETTAAKAPSAKAVKEMSQALTALRRARVPQSKIDKLTEGEVLEWGSDLKEVQANEDRRRRESKEPSKDPELEEASGSPGEEADPDDETDETQEFGPRMAEMQRDLLAQQARSELSESFPGLKDAETWKKVRELALKNWLESDDYDHFEDHFEGAQAVLRDAASALRVPRSASKVTSNVRDASQPSGSRPGDRYAAYKNMSPHELSMKLLGERVPPMEVRRIVEEIHSAR